MTRMRILLGLALVALLALACENTDPKPMPPAEEPKGEEKKPEEPKADAGSAPMDAGSVPMDAGAAPGSNPGSGPMDAGAAGGAPAADAGAMAGDAGGAPAVPDAVGKPDGKGGQVVTSELYGVQFTIPQDWKIEKSPTGISVSSPDNSVLMVIAGSKSQDLAEAALNDLKANLKFKDVSLDKQGTTVLNGLVGLRGEGDATMLEEGGKDQQIHFVGFATKVGEKAITFLIFTSKERYEKDATLIEGILNTLGKI